LPELTKRMAYERAAAVNGGFETRRTLAAAEGQSLRMDRDDGRTVGRFQYGLVSRHRPRLYPTWIAGVADMATAVRVAALLGGQPEVCECEQRRTWAVVTDTSELDILLPSANSIQITVICQHGFAVDLSPASVSTDDAAGSPTEDRRTLPCQCPLSLQERRRLAKAGRGGEILARVTLRLLRDPTLGSFTVTSTSWEFAKEAAVAKSALPSCPTGHSGEARLYLSHVRCTTASGKAFTFTTPTFRPFGHLHGAS